MLHRPSASPCRRRGASANDVGPDQGRPARRWLARTTTGATVPRRSRRAKRPTPGETKRSSSHIAPRHPVIDLARAKPHPAAGSRLSRMRARSSDGGLLRRCGGRRPSQSLAPEHRYLSSAERITSEACRSGCRLPFSLTSRMCDHVHSVPGGHVCAQLTTAQDLVCRS